MSHKQLEIKMKLVFIVCSCSIQMNLFSLCLIWLSRRRFIHLNLIKMDEKKQNVIFQNVNKAIFVSRSLFVIMPKRGIFAEENLACEGSEIVVTMKLLQSFCGAVISNIWISFASSKEMKTNYDLPFFSELNACSYNTPIFYRNAMRTHTYTHISFHFFISHPIFG